MDRVDGYVLGARRSACRWVTVAKMKTANTASRPITIKD
jgi:hypothetical protein